MKRMFVLLLMIYGRNALAQPVTLKIDWKDETFGCSSVPTLQVVVNPMLRRGAAMHDGSFSALRDLHADVVRYVPWFPYPRLGVAELGPPSASGTSWDFSLIDPIVIDFMEATKGHSVVMNFSIIPQWMIKTPKPVAYPKDPNQVCWGYNEGTELRDSTLKELTDYYVRLISWYTKGGFTDENGKFYQSGYHYRFDYWEVLNEPDGEHKFSPAMYSRIYDAVVTALRPLMPGTKFVGISVAQNKPEWFEYFLNPANHRPGIPLDMISYHFYASANPLQGYDNYEFSLFDNADAFIREVAYIESIKKRLSPRTKTDLNELGACVNEQMRDSKIPSSFFNLSGAIFAYLFMEFTRSGIDVIGESQLVGFPSQYPDVSMIDWETNKPNARFWTLKLIHDHLKPGSVLVKTRLGNNHGNTIAAQCFTFNGTKMALIVNKRSKATDLQLPEEFADATIQTVDERSGDNEAITSPVTSRSIALAPFSVNLIMLRN